MIKKVVTAIATLLTPVTALATELDDELRACSLLEDDPDRLACFDAVAAVLVDHELEVPVVDTAQRAARFGRPERRAAEAGPDEITTRHRGEFRGWSGDTVFRLENGQVWRQAGRGSMHWVADSPRVTIRRTRIGTYWLSVEGINARVRVSRVE